MKEFIIPVVIYCAVTVKAKSNGDAETQIRDEIYEVSKVIEKFANTNLDIKVKDTEVNP